MPSLCTVVSLWWGTLCFFSAKSLVSSQACFMSALCSKKTTTIVLLRNCRLVQVLHHINIRWFKMSLTPSLAKGKNTRRFLLYWYTVKKKCIGQIHNLHIPNYLSHSEKAKHDGLCLGLLHGSNLAKIDKKLLTTKFTT